MQSRHYGPPTQRARLWCQLPGTGLTYPHAHLPVVGKNRWLRFLYRGHREYLRRAAWAFSRFTRTAANFASDFERPPRRPIRDRYLVTSEGTGSTYRKPLSSSSPHREARNLRLLFTTYSLPLDWRRTSHYATCTDSNRLSQFRHRNKGLKLIHRKPKCRFP